MNHSPYGQPYNQPYPDAYPPAPGAYAPPARAYRQSGGIVKPAIAGGLMFAFMGIFFDFSSLPEKLNIGGEKEISYSACQEIVSEESRLSRDQLLQLLAIPERDSKEKVREVVQEPYCTLPTVEIRSGVAAEREAYPLEFEPETRLVILYEDNEYAGYRFSFE